MEKWSQGRVVLVGDAGYCPTPLTGMGTTVGFVGAYVLSQQILRNSGDFETAFSEYDRILRPFVQEAQKLPPGAPDLLNPQTRWGITILRYIMAGATKSGLISYLEKYITPAAEKYKLAEYDFVK